MRQPRDFSALSCAQLEVRFSGSSSGVLPVTLGDGGRIVLNLSPSLIPDDLLLSASCTKVGGMNKDGPWPILHCIDMLWMLQVRLRWG